jgi:hypothetical protein
MLFIVCIIGHWAACGFYLIPHLVNVDIAKNCVNEPDALYGTACEFQGTWIQMQIMTLKLPPDGGTKWERYLRALNWAIPTLTLEVIDDVFPINNQELMYGLFAMFFGMIIESGIIGTIISLVSEPPESQDVQIVRDLLEERNVDIDLRLRVLAHLNFLNSPYARTIVEEETLSRELPISLQLSIMQNTKLQLLNRCPLFNNCSEESKVNLCFALTQHIYSDGDYIIRYGDMGHEMFFIAEGSVDVSILQYIILHININI